MGLKFVLTICLLAYTAAAADIDVRSIINAQQQLMKVMLTSLSERAPLSPQESGLCFSSANSEQEKITNAYNEQYLGCSKTAQEEEDELTKQSADKRNDIISRGQNACSAMDACSSLNGYDFFSCHNVAASNSYPVIYGLSIESESQAATIKTQLQAIDSRMNVCITTARNKYNDDTYACTTKLQNCLGGAGWPTTPAPDTTPATTTTAAPTTAAPTTAAPTTAAPTTAAPATEEPEPTVDPEERSPEEDLDIYRYARVNARF